MPMKLSERVVHGLRYSYEDQIFEAGATAQDERVYMYPSVVLGKLLEIENDIHGMREKLWMDEKDAKEIIDYLEDKTSEFLEEWEEEEKEKDL